MEVRSRHPLVPMLHVLIGDSLNQLALRVNVVILSYRTKTCFHVGVSGLTFMVADLVAQGTAISRSSS